MHLELGHEVKSDVGHSDEAPPPGVAPWQPAHLVRLPEKPRIHVFEYLFPLQNDHFQWSSRGLVGLLCLLHLHDTSGEL